MTFRTPVLVALSLGILIARPLSAQEAGEELLQTIADLDASVFGAFNDRDVERFLASFSKELEFYHDQTGLTGYPELIESSERLLGQASPLRRRLVPGSLEVYAVPGYGAMEIGEHEFCHEENGVDDCGVFGFTHVWRLTPDGWKITRVLSYGH